MNKVLLLGNGFNRLTNKGISWQAVIENLAQYVGKVETITRYLEEKPFTLVFEEIFFRAARVRGISEKELKQHTAKVINAVPSNDVHKLAVEAGASAILTTNYDYNFEDSSKGEFGESLTHETRYSIFRRRCKNDFCIWHIHGESSHPDSLVLSHEHYSDYIDQIKGFVKDYEATRTPRSGARLSLKRTRKDNNWVEIFLQSDIHAIGLGFDYTEIELWWLLSTKERFRLKGIEVGSTTYYGVEPIVTHREAAKHSILESFGIKVVDKFRTRSYRDSYEKFFENFSKA